MRTWRSGWLASCALWLLAAAGWSCSSPCPTTSPATVVVQAPLPAHLRPATAIPRDGARDAAGLVAVDASQLATLLGRTAKLAAGWRGLDPEDLAHLHGEALEAAERVSASVIVGKGRILVERETWDAAWQRLAEAERYWQALEALGEWER